MKCPLATDVTWKDGNPSLLLQHHHFVSVLYHTTHSPVLPFGIHFIAVIGDSQTPRGELCVLGCTRQTVGATAPVTHEVSKQWREAFGTVLSGVTGWLTEKEVRVRAACARGNINMQITKENYGGWGRGIALGSDLIKVLQIGHSLRNLGGGEKS